MIPATMSSCDSLSPTTVETDDRPIRVPVLRTAGQTRPHSPRCPPGRSGLFPAAPLDRAGGREGPVVGVTGARLASVPNFQQLPHVSTRVDVLEPPHGHLAVPTRGDRAAATPQPPLP